MVALCGCEIRLTNVTEENKIIRRFIGNKKNKTYSIGFNENINMLNCLEIERIKIHDEFMRIFIFSSDALK